MPLPPVSPPRNRLVIGLSPYDMRETYFVYSNDFFSEIQSLRPSSLIRPLESDVHLLGANKDPKDSKELTLMLQGLKS